jgi:dihydropteroate synthase
MRRRIIMVKHRYVSLWIFLAVFLLLTVFMVTQAGIVKADSPEGSEPPAFQSTPYQMSQELGTRWIDIYIDPVNEAYYDVVLLPDGATPPSKEQVVAGTDGDGNPALDSINIKFKTTGTNVRVYAEKHSTDYDIYVVLRDDAGNLSEPAMLDVVSPQGAQYIMPDGISWFKEEDGSRQILVDVRLQNINPDYKGKVYWVLLPMGAEEPIIDQIAAGTDGAGNPAVSMGSPEFDPSEGSGHFLAPGAAGDTTYNLYLVVGNTENYYPLSRCTEVQQLSVTTPPDIPDEKVCEMNGTQYGTLAEALNEVDSTATIKLLKSLTTVESVIINKKHITFDLNGHVLNIHTAADEGLKVTEGTVSLEGEGELNVTGRLYGVSADLQSSVTVTNAAASNTDVSDSATSVGVLAQKGSEVTVRGNATGTDHGIRAENIYTEIKCVLDNYERKNPWTLSCRDLSLTLGERTLVMGILNVTPDSFSDGGKYIDPGLAVEHAHQMVEDGADIIDIGGESTRPSTWTEEPLSAEEEIQRLVPVLKRLVQEIDLPISVDTYKAETARAALEIGAHMINDIWGFQRDPEIALVAAEYDVPVVLMHNQDGNEYEDMMSDILAFLRRSVDIAQDAGVKPEQIILDPGIGFGKDAEQNLRVMRHLREFRSLGKPVLLGTSRKSTIGKTLDLPPDQRLEGSLATIVWGVAQGAADIVRVHDVKESVRAMRMIDAIVSG